MQETSLLKIIKYPNLAFKFIAFGANKIKRDNTGAGSNNERGIIIKLILPGQQNDPANTLEHLSRGNKKFKNKKIVCM